MKLMLLNQKHTSMARSWYSYVSGNALEPSSYFRSNTKPGCLTGCCVCVIYQPNGDINPGPLSANMQKYIIDALMTCTPQPPGPGVKKYIYGKAC